MLATTLRTDAAAREALTRDMLSMRLVPPDTPQLSTVEAAAVTTRLVLSPQAIPALAAENIPTTLDLGEGFARVGPRMFRAEGVLHVCLDVPHSVGEAVAAKLRTCGFRALGLPDEITDPDTLEPHLCSALATLALSVCDTDVLRDLAQDVEDGGELETQRRWLAALMSYSVQVASVYPITVHTLEGPVEVPCHMCLCCGRKACGNDTLDVLCNTITSRLTGHLIVAQRWLHSNDEEFLALFDRVTARAGESGVIPPEVLANVPPDRHPKVQHKWPGTTLAQRIAIAHNEVSAQAKMAHWAGEMLYTRLLRRIPQECHQYGRICEECREGIAAAAKSVLYAAGTTFVPTMPVTMRTSPVELKK